MQVRDKLDDVIYEVFDIIYDSATGYPHFLIYKDNQWVRMSAKHFMPADTIVRCAECIHRGTTACMMYHEYWMETFDEPCFSDYTHDNGYCHAGERWNKNE